MKNQDLKQSMSHLLLTLTLVTVSSFLSSFVLMLLWNWFHPLFKLPVINFKTAYAAYFIITFLKMSPASLMKRSKRADIWTAFLISIVMNIYALAAGWIIYNFIF